MFRRSTLRSCLALLLLAAVTGPWLTGCAQLGIAKTEDVDAMEASLTRANGATSDKVDAVSAEVAQIDPQLQALTAQVDSLNASIAAMTAMMTDLNIESIAIDAKNAARAASVAETKLSAIGEAHLNALVQRQEMTAEEIRVTKQLMTGLEEAGDAEPGAEPKSDGGDAGGGSSDGGS